MIKQSYSNLYSVKEEEEKYCQEAVYEKFKKSKVILTDEERKRINNFFNVPLMSTDLLYRASSNDFSTDKFH